MVWYWCDTPYSLAQIAEGDFLPQDTHMATAWAFAQSWLQGQASFTLPTSGSTGTPQTITLTRLQMQASAQRTANALALHTHKTALLAINPTYIGGKMMVVRAIESGLALTGIPPTSNPFLALQKSIQLQDFIALVPAQLHAIANETPRLLPRLNESKAIILGGGAVDEALSSIIQTLDVPVYNTYGMTETVSHIALKRLNGTGKTAYFQALEDITLAIDGRNCLKIKGDITQEAWLQTNDVVQLLDNQRFVWQGRADNTLNTGGIKVQIEVLESKIAVLLANMHLPTHFAVAGVPDAKWQQKIVLFLELPALPAPVLENLRATFKTTLLRHEVPKEIYFVTNFPRTETGKIRRTALIETIAS